LVSAFVAATSTASLMAMPSEPVESGVSPRIRFPTWVVSLGDAWTVAPNVSIITRR
jgi:hypothetical protein